MNIPLTGQKLSALALAATLAGALSLASTLNASQTNPADPYEYTAGQYPSLLQSYGLPPQYSGQESMGMRQARYASGQNQVALSTITNGAVAVVIETPTPAVNATATPAIATAVASNQAPTSPVMGAINASLSTIAATRGASAAADSNDIASSFSAAPYDCHAMLSVYQLRVNASANEVDSLQARAAQFAGDTQTKFTSAVSDMQASRAKLDQDFAAAQNATPDNWSSVRSSLATDYRAYSEAVARAESAANNRT